MMQVISKTKYLRTSSRKMRLISKGLKGLRAQQALIYLDQIEKRSVNPIKKALVSALANATNNLQLVKDQVHVKNIVIDDGPSYKRIRPISRGQAHPILKRTSHITVILEGEKEAKK